MALLRDVQHTSVAPSYCMDSWTIVPSRLGAELDQDQTDPGSTTSLLLETLWQVGVWGCGSVDESPRKDVYVSGRKRLT